MVAAQQADAELRAARRYAPAAELLPPRLTERAGSADLATDFAVTLRFFDRAGGALRGSSAKDAVCKNRR
jgi:hypothetical protein